MAVSYMEADELERRATSPDERFGALIRRKRESQGVSMQWVAERIGYALQTVRHWERGMKAANMEPIRRTFALADVLGITNTELADILPECRDRLCPVAKWVYVRKQGGSCYVCSRCKAAEEKLPINRHYCGHCGAKMTWRKADEDHTGL